MILCKVIGNVAAQQKEESLVGKRMLLCQTEETGKLERVVAVDLVGAGVGSEVLVSRPLPVHEDGQAALQESEACGDEVHH